MARRARAAKKYRVSRALDSAFFIIAGGASVWLAYLVLRQGFVSGWSQVWFYVLFWLLLAYVALPRLHRILTDIYVPDYFIGRTRTSDGLLGDPVNLALLGDEAQLHQAMLAAGWTRADDVSLRSGLEIVRSTLLRRSYDRAPVSPLLLFGRNQDFAYQQEVSGNPSRRHHVRFWRCPDGWRLPGGARADWLAAGTYDRAVGFSLFTLQITHKIAPDTDAERDHILATLTSNDAAVSVTVLQDFATGYHARNGGGDAIETDGDLPVVDLYAVKVAAPAAAQVDTAVPVPRRRRAGAPRKPVLRPSPTVFGAAIVLLRAVTPLVVYTGAMLGWVGLRDVLLIDDSTESFSDAEIAAESTAYLVGAILFLLYQGALGVFVLFGSNVARVVVMLSTVASIAVSAVAHFEDGEEISLATNLVALSLDILILTALSSSRARDFAHRKRAQLPVRTDAVELPRAS